MKRLLLKVIPLEILLLFILCEIRSSTDGANVCGNSPGFECHDASKCIPLYQYCNGSSQCSDGSDEILYNKAIHDTTGISCGHRINGNSTYCYLPNQYLCDHEINCFWGEDEKNCSHTFECGYVPFANKTQYKIKIVFCDNVVNCINGADERKYSPGAPGYQCSVTKTHLTNYCMLPDQYVCDGTNDCDYGTDECFCGEGDSSNIYTGDNCFRCLNRELVVPNKQRCDGAFHCNDLSDECLCTKRPPICEQICKVGENCGSCKVGEIKCKTSSDGFEKCINRTNVCDRIVDCAMGEDEKNCSVHESQLFQCSDKKQFVQKYQRCDNDENCKDGSDELGCQNLYKCSEARYDSNGVVVFDRAAYTEACDKIALCEDLDDECNSTLCGPDVPAYCDHVNGALGFICPNSKSAIIGTEVCDGYPTCNESARTTSADELNCPNRFYCADHGATRLPIHIAPEARCNAITDCFDGSDEVNCSTATHFYCVPGTADYIPRSKVCNGVFDCKNGQNDECQNCAVSPFSTDQFLISNYFLQAFIWIVGFLAIFGNIAVLVHNGLQMYENKNTSAIAYCNRILVLNLAMSDFLLGVYLLSIGIVNSVYANTYCVTDIEWRTSVSCAGLGSIALISVQTSVFILTIMTTFRLVLVTQPFNSTVRVEVIGGVLALAWVVSFVIALIPHSWALHDYFSSKAWLTDNPYLFVTNRSDVESFVQRLWSLEDQNSMYFSNGSTEMTWTNMVQTIALLNPKIGVKKYFGYYSAHGVCLPLLFPDPSQDTAWGLSLFIIILNFLAFVYMVTAYVLVYRITRQRAKKAGSSEKAANKLQKKVTRIVISNFCCWIPICIMAFISVGGVKLSSEAYAASAIVLLPINSAANPFLYSNLPDLIWEKLKPIKDKVGRTESRSSSSALGQMTKQTDTGIPNDETKM